jgi:serine/threonine protein phosphatase 1
LKNAGEHNATGENDMTYVVANLHGQYEKWKKLVEEIGFEEDDVLYVLGDLVDYGEESMELLCDLSMRYNVLPVVGEHDWRAVRMLTGFEKMRRSSSSKPDASYIAEMQTWVQEGGQVTLEGFRALDDEMREGVLDYLSDLALYEEIEVNGVTYRMVHGGIPAGLSADGDFDDCDPEEFWETPLDFTADYTDSGVVVIAGHCPTGEIPGGKAGKIFRGKGCIGVWCGEDVLGCLCLETDEEYYVR